MQSHDSCSTHVTLVGLMLYDLMIERLLLCGSKQ